MNLKIANGVVSGTYSTAVGAPDPKDEFEIRGIVADDLISFIVGWRNQTVDYRSMTAWVGQLTKDDDAVTDRLETLWHLAKNIPDADEPAMLWGTVRTGADRFRRNAFPNVNKLLSANKRASSEPLKVLSAKAKKAADQQE